MNDIDILNQRAIDAAISHKWEDAVELNKQALEIDPNKLDANLRMGFAYLQLEDIKKAKKFYQKALRIQSKNPVALENLDRISVLEGDKGKHPIKTKATLNPSMFLEVPGKTKSVSLVNLGQKKHIAELDIGESIVLNVKKRKIEVRTPSGNYIGYLPDDLSKRLIFFIEANSQYSAYVKEASGSRVVIFMREDKKGPKVAHHSSFPAIVNFDMIRDSEEEHADNEDSSNDDDEWTRMLTHDQEEEPVKDFPIHRDADDEDD